MCDSGMIDAQKYNYKHSFNIKHEQWSTNTIYLSVLKHFKTLYFQTDLNGFWREEEE